MKMWNMVIDVAKCHDCNNCFLSCKDEYCENDFLPYSVSQPRHGHRWMNIMRKEKGQYPRVGVAYLPIPCMHCDNAPCIKASRDGAVSKRKDGIVIIDPDKAKGQKDIVDSCPYGVVWWNEEQVVPQKCTFCVHLLEDGWETPRCVQACPTGAMRVVLAEKSEMVRTVKSEGLEIYKPEYKTKPRVFYKNLELYTRCHISGSVALKDADECADGARVVLIKAGKKIDEAVTNNYGDFKIDGLGENSGKYGLEIEYHGYRKQALKVNLKDSIDVGTVFLWLRVPSFDHNPDNRQTVMI